MKDRYFDIYRFAHSIPGKIIRFGPVSVASLLFLLTDQNRTGVINTVASIGVFLLNEIFLAAKVSRIEPEFKVKDEEGDYQKMMIFSARQKFIKSENAAEIFEKIKNINEVKFFLSKAGINDIGKTSISKDELLKQAMELVKYVKGSYIAEIDLAAAYLILADDDSRVLSKNDLLNEDIVNILYWARKRFRTDVFKKKKLQFVGIGVFDSLVSGWDYETKKYTRDLTAYVFSKHFSPIISGYEDEFDQLKIALSKASNANVILVGEPGVGKTSLVEYLAYESFVGDVPSYIRKKRVYELYVDKLLAGIESRGELEERLSLLFSEIAHSDSVIIFIQNIENILGGGGFDFDISGVLAEYLNSDRVKLIGTTTPAAYEAFVADKKSINEYFDVINIEELDVAKSLLLIAEKTDEIEIEKNVNILYSALKQCVLLSPMYYPDKFYPDRALSLLDEVVAGSRINKIKKIDGAAVNELVHKKTNVAIGLPDDNDKEILLNLEDKLHARIIGQDEAINVISDAMRRVRSGFGNKEKPIATFLFLGPTGVGKTETAKTLAKEYFGAEDTLIRINMNELASGNGYEKIIGSKNSYVNSLTEQITQKPFSLILLDEFEKSSREIMNMFLQIFDEGFIVDASGKNVSFKNAIIIATTNAGSELIREKKDIEKTELIDLLLRDNIFSPELINRFDDVVLFKTLNENEIESIAKILLDESGSGLRDNQIEIVFDDKVISKVAHESYDAEFGARNVRRYIEDNVEKYVSDLILENKIKKGDKVKVSIDRDNKFVLTS